MRPAVYNFNRCAFIKAGACAQKRVEQRGARLANSAARLHGIFLAAADSICALPAQFIRAWTYNRVKTPVRARLNAVPVDDVRSLSNVIKAVLFHFIIPRGRESGGVFCNILRVRPYVINCHRRQHRIHNRFNRSLKCAGAQRVFNLIRSGLLIERTAFLACDIVEAFFAFQSVMGSA